MDTDMSVFMVTMITDMTEHSAVFEIKVVYCAHAGCIDSQKSAPSSVSMCSCLFRVVNATLSSSYNIPGLVPVCWLLFQWF